MAVIAASIVTYRTDSDELSRCLDSLDGGIFDQIYVIDNSQSEETRRLCENRGGIEYIPSENIGYGAAHNIALRKSLALRRDYHLVLNPDISFRPADIKILLDYMERNEDVGALQPLLLNPDGSIQYTARMVPAPFDLILRRFLPHWFFRRKRAEYELRHIDHTRPFNAPVHQGSFMLLRCAVLHRVGLFDERFFMYPEDIDLTRRIHAVSRTMFVPSVSVVHDHRAQSYRNLKMLRIHIVNMIRYFNKWGWLSDAQRRRFNRELQPKATDADK